MMDLYYISVKDLQTETGLSRAKARRAIREVTDDLISKGCIPPPRGKAPRRMVMRRLGLEWENENLL